MGEVGRKRGFFSRVFGAADTPRPATPAARSPANTIIIPQVPGSGTIAGSEYYQDGYKRLRQGPEQLELRCEPDNPHDSNAVMVLARGKQIGYLWAPVAAEYHQIIAQLQAEGAVCIVGEICTINGLPSARLSLPPWDWLSQWAATSPANRGLPPAEPRRVNLKRLGDYQEELSHLLDGRDWVEVAAVVSGYEQPTGKWQGETSLMFDVDGTTIGLLPAQYADEASSLIRRVEREGPQRIPVDIRRPRDGRPLYAVFFQHD